MDIIKPIKPEPTSWTLIDVQVNSSDDNPFEVVDSFESQVTLDDGEKSDQQEKQATDARPEIPLEVARSEKLEKSVQSIQQSLESLQSESRSNSSEIESIRSRLDQLLLRSSRSSPKLDIACNCCGMEIAAQS